MTRPQHPNVVTRAQIPPFALEPGLPCRDVDPDLFFADLSANTGKATNSQAKAVCRPCPQKDACLKWAVETRQVYGVWGGTTAPERVAIRRRTA